MLIAIDVQSTLPPVSGLGAYTQGLVAALQRYDQRNQYVYFSCGNTSRLSTPAQVIREQWSLPVAAMREQIDVLHTPGFAAPRWGKKRRVMTLHDLSVMEREEILASNTSRWYWSSYLPRTAKHCDAVITPSHFTAERAHQLLDISHKRLWTIHYPVREHFRQATAAQQTQMRKALGVGRQYILCVGALEPRKDVITLLRAFARIESVCRHELVLAGPVHLASYGLAVKAEIQRLGLGRRVLRLGYVEEGWMPALYSGADVFVFPETYAGWGLPMLEAMACGTPVIAFDNTALREAGGGAALLLRDASAPALAEAMLGILQDVREQSRRREAGLRRVALLRWDAAVDAHMAVYEGSVSNDSLAAAV